MSARKMPTAKAIRRTLVGEFREQSKRDIKRGVIGSILAYGSSLIIFGFIAWIHLLQHRLIPLWVALAALLWSYCAAIAAMGVNLWPDVRRTSFDEKRNREEAALFLLQGCDKAEIIELEYRALLETEFYKAFVEGLTVIAATLSAIFAASIAITDKKIAMASLLTAMMPYVALLILITIFALLISTGKRLTYRRIAWIARKASGQPLESSPK